MTPDATCIGANDRILDAAKKMTDLGVGALPICGSDQLLKGMLTDGATVVKVLGAGKGPATCTAGELTQGEAVAIGADDAAEIPRPWPSTRSAAVGALLEALSS
ncbi:CBS domain-containing protein [Streptomyces goshikiensis]|uniref:CBS domain-containing protein n=1 Tax=Streptomyces goshikiensis TaxID=1942 RepID=UPI003D9F075D